LEVFPWDSGPRYLLQDRNERYGEKFREAANWLGIQEVLTAPQSPWRNAYFERLIGSIRRECLDHVIAFNAASLRRVLKSYFEYYERGQTHLSLGKDAPISRSIQPPALGRIVELPQVGGAAPSLRTNRGLIGSLLFRHTLSSCRVTRLSCRARLNARQRDCRAESVKRQDSKKFCVVKEGRWAFWWGQRSR